eukprot:gene13637-biopygen5041
MGDSRGDTRGDDDDNGWQQGDDEPHLAKEQHGPITTQNIVQRMCPIVRLHRTRSRQRTPRVLSKDAKLGAQWLTPHHPLRCQRASSARPLHLLW